MKRFLIIAMIVVSSGAQGQSFLTLNASYPESYQIGFHNPGPLALFSNLRAAVGMQWLYAGLAGDALRNHYLNAVIPVGNGTAVGLSARYFTSDVFGNMELSLQASHAFYRDKISMGVNVNMLQYGYNKENFLGFDMRDPVIANGASSSAISFGAGFYFQPLRDFHLGISANHLNEPDISLSQTGIRQKAIYSAGVTYSALPIVPQLDIRLEGEAVAAQAGAHVRLLDDQLRLFTGYNQYLDQGSNALAEAELRLKNLGLLYAFQYPLTADLSTLSNGSHQIGVVFEAGGPQASVPTVMLESIDSRLQIPQVWLKGKVANQDGLKAIEIRCNEQLVKTISSAVLKKAQTYNLSETVPLVLGSNTVQVTAKGLGAAASDKVFAWFEPPPPQIRIVSEKNTQIKSEQYPLQFQVSDQNELKQLRIYHGDALLETIASFPNIKEMDVTRQLRLTEGNNVIRIEAENSWRANADSLWIVYKSKEPQPSLTINSPDLPISASSQIIINLNLNNAENIKEVIIKVNGVAVDTARIVRLKLFEERMVAGYDSAVVVNLTNQNKNLIEAIAIDDQGLPRISQSLDVYYNPYAREMRYSSKRAFVIGINNYVSTEVPDLVDAVPDARKIAAVLDTVYHFDRIDLFLDEQANFEALYALFSDSLLRAKPKELVVIYFSGHGDKLSAGAEEALGFLLPSDAAPASHSKRITMDYISSYLRRSPAADVLCIFDACFSGASIVARPEFTYDLMPRRVAYDSLRREVGKRALNLITAATRNEAAVDGLFTSILVRGLQGAADRNDDGYITSTELAMYVQKFTGDEARNRYFREQNPQFGGLTSERGECVFERRR